MADDTVDQSSQDPLDTIDEAPATNNADTAPAADGSAAPAAASTVPARSAVMTIHVTSG